jgi:hypothetical protein
MAPASNTDIRSTNARMAGSVRVLEKKRNRRWPGLWTADPAVDIARNGC